MVRATQNVFGGGVEEKVEGAKEEEKNNVEKGNDFLELILNWSSKMV